MVRRRLDALLQINVEKFDLDSQLGDFQCNLGQTWVYTNTIGPKPRRCCFGSSAERSWGFSSISFLTTYQIQYKGSFFWRPL